MSLGGGGSSGGGGGSSGKVSWPSYLQDSHWDLIRHGQDNQSHLDDGISMFDAVNQMWDNSPYAGAYAYDPTDNLADIQTRYDTFDAYLGTVAPTTLLSSFLSAGDTPANATVTKAQTRLDAADVFGTALVPATAFGTFYDAAAAKLTSRVDALLDAIEAKQVGQIARRTARFAAGARDINAVMGSSFVFGLALIEQTAQQDLDDAAAKLHMDENAQLVQLVGQMVQLQSLRNQYELGASQLQLSINQTRYGKLSEYIGFLGTYLQLRLAGEHSSTQLLTELSRIQIVAQKEFLSDDLELATKDYVWNAEIFQYAANLLASVQGGTSGFNPTAKNRSGGSSLGGALGGAASGAMLGATLAAPTGGLSVAAGALIGAIGGGGASFLG